MPEHHIPVQPCPCCDYKIDAASNAKGGGKSPVPGDLSICINCGTLLMFKDDLSHEIADPAMLAKLSDETKIVLQKLMAAWRQVKPKMDRAKREAKS
jgi:hypothetical protein